MLRRRSIRLPGYDYAQAGAYFVALCTHGKECIFGEIVDDMVRLNKYGEIVREEWLRTAEVRSNVTLDEFVIMPNHVHGIIVIADAVRATSPLRHQPHGHPVRSPVQLARSSGNSNRLSPNASTCCAARRARWCGSAIITNTSSATTALSIASGNTSSTIPRAGLATTRIPIDARSNPALRSDHAHTKAPSRLGYRRG
jgi:hypothetical protein